MSKGVRRFEVFTGVGKRRDWPNAVKASILAECWPGGDTDTITAVITALRASR